MKARRWELLALQDVLRPALQALGFKLVLVQHPVMSGMMVR